MLKKAQSINCDDHKYAHHNIILTEYVGIYLKKLKIRCFCYKRVNTITVIDTFKVTVTLRVMITFMVTVTITITVMAMVMVTITVTLMKRDGYASVTTCKFLF